MVHAIRIHEHGGADVLRFESVDPGMPGPGQVRLRQRACGVNFIDIYQRTGLYELPSLPAVLGLEGAGDVLAVGEGVTEFKVGDRVAYGGVLGGYSEERLAPAERLVRLPDAISYETAAAMMVRGMTARFLLREAFPMNARTVALYHAAAGGVGLIACQWARAIGATLIGTVSTDEKAELALANGCTHIINYKRENFVERVKEITSGRGCDVVYDSVGKDTFPASLDCLKPKGMWVSFGNASGPVPPFNLTALKGSLFATRPSLFPYIAAREDLLANAKDLFAMVTSGKIKIAVYRAYPLSAAADAQRALESRQTTGSVVLTT